MSVILLWVKNLAKGCHQLKPRWRVTDILCIVTSLNSQSCCLSRLTVSFIVQITRTLQQWSPRECSNGHHENVSPKERVWFMGTAKVGTWHYSSVHQHSYSSVLPEIAVLRVTQQLTEYDSKHTREHKDPQMDKHWNYRLWTMPLNFSAERALACSSRMIRMGFQHYQAIYSAIELYQKTSYFNWLRSLSKTLTANLCMERS